MREVHEVSVLDKDIRANGYSIPILKKGLGYLPGLLLLLLVGYTGKIIALYIPHTEYVIFAIAVGMLISNVLPIPSVFWAGIRTYELWLKAGIVLMGVRFILAQIVQVGSIGLMLVAVEILVSFITATYLGKYFGLKDRLISLIGMGGAICGVSAIIGAMGAIDADEDDASYAIATVLISGAIMVFAFPLMGKIMAMSDHAFGMWAGLCVDNTAETIATGFAYSEGAGQIATLVKLSRNALMGLVILMLAVKYARQEMTGQIMNKASFLWDRFPKFLLGFLAVSCLTSLGVFSPDQVTAISNLSKWAFLLTFAGVGLSLQVSKMKAGIKPFLVGFGVEACVAAATLVIIRIIFPW